MILALTLSCAGVSACAHQAPVVLSAAPCLSLVPEGWRQGVPAPALPAGSTAGDWAAYADEAVGALDKSNGRLTDTLDILDACERRDAEVAAKLERPWWRVF